MRNAFITLLVITAITELFGQETPRVEVNRLWTISQDSVIEIENEGFESGLGNFENSGILNWTTTNTDFVLGMQSATSNVVFSGQNAVLELSVEIDSGRLAILDFFIKRQIVSGMEGSNLAIVKLDLNGDTLSLSGNVVSPLPNNQWVRKTYYLTESQVLRWIVENSSIDDEIRVYLDEVAIRSEPSAIRIVDGNEGFGKVLMSDANGNASWRNLGEINDVDNPGDYGLPLILDGRNSIMNSLEVRNNTNFGIWSRNNNLWGYHASGNGTGGYQALGGPYGFFSQATSLWGFNASAGAGGFRANSNTGDGFRSEFNEGNGFIAVNNPTGFYASSNENVGFWAASNNAGFFATSNDYDGYLASGNDRYGYLASGNSMDGFSSENNTLDGYIATNNNDDGYSAISNDDAGFYSGENGDDGFVAFDNVDIGYVASVNGDDGFYSASNGDFGYYSFNNTNDGVYSFGNGGDEGYFSGTVTVTGALSKGSGSFKIDHPLDPENKFLYHSFVESPDMMNVYNGNVILDENGEAVVKLEDWFTVLNKDFRYQLTCIGGFAPVYVADKIKDNAFRIAGGRPGLEVSWQVTGIRQDPYAEQNRIQVEVDKPNELRGYYLHPEAYGRGFNQSLDYIKLGRKSMSELMHEQD